MAGVQTIFEFASGAMSDIVAVMTKSGNEIMLIPIGIMVVGAAIGLASRLIGR